MPRTTPAPFLRGRNRDAVRCRVPTNNTSRNRADLPDRTGAAGSPATPELEQAGLPRKPGKPNSSALRRTVGGRATPVRKQRVAAGWLLARFDGRAAPVVWRPPAL